MTARDEACRICRYYAPLTLREVEEEIGQCRRHPPRKNAVKVSTMGVGIPGGKYASSTSVTFPDDAFPWVPASLWCGEFAISDEEQGKGQ